MMARNVHVRPDGRGGFRMRGAGLRVRGPRSSTGLATQRRGLTILEVVLTMSILLTAILGLSQALLDSIVSNGLNRQMSLATDGSRQVVSDLQGVALEEVFGRYNESQNGNLLGGRVIAAGGFAIAGLNPLPGDPDGLVGQIRFPEFDEIGVTQLREDIVDPDFGSPRDLNGDGVVGDGVDHAADYRILPVVIEIDWNGAAGPAHMQFKTVLSRY